MKRAIGWICRKRRIVAGMVFFALGLSLFFSGSTTYADETTNTEQTTNVESNTAAVEASSMPEAEQTSEETSETDEKQEEGKSEKKNTLVVKRKKCTYPKKIYKGQPFTVKGTLRANHRMAQVEASIVDPDGECACKVRKKVKGTEFDLSKVDEKMKFGELDAGTYTYQVNVVDTYGNNQTALERKFRVKETDWMWPVSNSVLGDGFRCHCASHGGRHLGVDIKGVSRGTDIHAVHDGEVVYAKYHSASSLSSFGKLVILYHGDGIYSYYAHCQSLKCEVGDTVEQGDVIATVGATGAAFGTHLHLELRKGPVFNGKYNHYKLLSKYKYKQFNPMKKHFLKYIR